MKPPPASRKTFQGSHDKLKALVPSLDLSFQKLGTVLPNNSRAPNILAKQTPINSEFESWHCTDGEGKNNAKRDTMLNTIKKQQRKIKSFVSPTSKKNRFSSTVLNQVQLRIP